MRASVLLACSLFLPSLIPIARAQLVNGSFELPGVPDGGFTTYLGGSTAIPGWTVVGDEVTIFHTNYMNGSVNHQAHQGSHWIDLTGTGTNSFNNGIQQIVPTMPGAEYTVRFRVGSISDFGIHYPWTTIDLSINGGDRVSYFNGIAPTIAINWLNFTVPFTALDTTTSLTFYNGSGEGNLIAALDTIVMTFVAAPLPGDFDFDKDLDANDIDIFFGMTSTTLSPESALFDLNNDQVVNRQPNGPGSDADVWVRTLKASEYGDTNFSGTVDFDDLLALAQHYGSASGGWASGNFDGVDGVGFDDLLLLAQQYGFGTPALTQDQFAADWALARSIVPEPAFALLAGSGMILGRRRRSSARS